VINSPSPERLDRPFLLRSCLSRRALINQLNAEYAAHQITAEEYAGGPLRRPGGGGKGGAEAGTGVAVGIGWVPLFALRWAQIYEEVKIQKAVESGLLPPPPAPQAPNHPGRSPGPHNLTPSQRCAQR